MFFYYTKWTKLLNSKLLTSMLSGKKSNGSNEEHGSIWTFWMSFNGRPNPKEAMECISIWITLINILYFDDNYEELQRWRFGQLPMIERWAWEEDKSFKKSFWRFVCSTIVSPTSMRRCYPIRFANTHSLWMSTTDAIWWD